MSDPLEELRRAREEAREAREHAKEIEREARDRARELEREAREQQRRIRHATRGRPSHHAEGPEEAEPEGIRAAEAFSLEGVREVRIRQTAGRLTLRPCAEDESPGVVSGGQKSAPQLEVERQGDRLEISIRQSKGWLFRRGQGARTVVRLIDGLDSLKVDLGAGDLEARDLAGGKMEFDVGAGEVRCYSLSCALKVDVGAGKIVVNDHSGLVECNTGTGDLLIDIARLVEGAYSGEVGMGRVEVRLPPGEQVFVEAHSGIGRGRTEYPSAGEGAATSVRVNSGIGEALIKARELGREPARPRPSPPAGRAPGRATSSRGREPEQLRVLQMLEQGKITSQEAADLIAALQGAAPPPAEEGNGD